MAREIRPKDRGWDRDKVNLVVAQLARNSGVVVETNQEEVDIGSFQYVVGFRFEDVPPLAKVTVFLSLAEYQTTSDVTITNMTTLPQTSCRHGFGSQAIRL